MPAELRLDLQLPVGEESGIAKIKEKPQPLGRVVTGFTANSLD